jgi:alkylated DNA repair dioxygenase AlkB
MDSFIIRKRPRGPSPSGSAAVPEVSANCDEESTDIKLAMLASIFPDIQQDILLDSLIANDGSIVAARSILSGQACSRKRRSTNPSHCIQSSLSSYGIADQVTPNAGSKSLTKKGKVLHLFSAEDIAKYTSCSIIHNFLPQDEANSLLKELLEEAKTFERQTFQLFDTAVQSPHSAGFYVSSLEEQREQISEYSYNGHYQTDVRQITPLMRQISVKVQKAVNDEIEKRIRSHYPGGQKLKYQSSQEWIPNAAFVNCYDGPAESVGYHSDELTYLGPRAVIGSLSLGVAREFRVRRIVPPDGDAENDNAKDDRGKSLPYTPDSDNRRPAISKTSASPLATTPTPSRADTQGQISIHLPHNSLLVMHAETQEEWKHSISPAQTITPHPISGNKRINVTYRWYRASFHPKHTPRCRCGMPCVLRCVQRKKETKGRYMWMCYAGYAPGQVSCSFFQWADFDDDGEPVWN